MKLSNRAAGGLLAFLVGVCGFLGWRIWELTTGDLTDRTSLSEAVEEEPDAAEDLIAAWIRSEMAEYSAVGEAGLIADGASSSTEDIIVQWNEQKLVNRGGTIIYERDGNTETCRQAAEEIFCTPEAPIPTLAETETELRNLLVTEQAHYNARYSPRPDCYDVLIDLSKGAPTTLFGLESTFCFDADTGALRSKSVKSVRRTELFEITSLSAEVDPDAFAGTFPAAILQRFFAES